MGTSTLLLLALVVAIPVAGFVLTISHARTAGSIRESRWRKRHGVVFWTFLPGLAGLITVLGIGHVLPDLFTLLGILLLAFCATLSLLVRRKHERS